MINPMQNETNMIKLWGSFLPSIEVGTTIEKTIRDF
jgi:hypothetical protein